MRPKTPLKDCFKLIAIILFVVLAPLISWALFAFVIVKVLRAMGVNI
jgi:hypothetical protein